MPRTDAPLAPPSSSSCNVASRISSSVRARRGPGRLRLLGAATGRLLRLTSSWTAYSICTTYKYCTALRDRYWDDRDPSSLPRPGRRAAGPAGHQQDPPASDASLATHVAQASGGPAALRCVGHREPGRLGIHPGWLHGMGPEQHIPYRRLVHGRRMVRRLAQCITCPENLQIRYLSNQELRQLRQAPGREGQVTLGRLRHGDLLDLPPLAQGELQRVATLVPRVQRIESVGVEIIDHIAHPVIAGETPPSRSRPRPCPGPSSTIRAPPAR